MDIKLIPLEKMILDGKEIRLGEKKQAVISVLGEPESLFSESLSTSMRTTAAGAGATIILTPSWLSISTRMTALNSLSFWAATMEN